MPLPTEPPWQLSFFVMNNGSAYGIQKVLSNVESHLVLNGEANAAWSKQVMVIHLSGLVPGSRSLSVNRMDI